MEQKIKAIVRVANTDIDGNKSVYMALRKIRGISFMFSNAICNYLNLEKQRKVGTLEEKEIKEDGEIMELAQPEDEVEVEETSEAEEA